MSAELFPQHESHPRAAITGGRRQDGDHHRGEASHLPGSRIDSILAKSSAKSFDVDARVYAAGDGAAGEVRSAGSAFAGIDGDYYSVSPVVHTGEDPDPVVEAIETQAFRAGDGLSH